MNYSIFPHEGLVRLPQVLDYLNISKSTWWQGVKDGRFPQPIRLGGVTAWRAKDVRGLAGDVEC